MYYCLSFVIYFCIALFCSLVPPLCISCFFLKQNMRARYLGSSLFIYVVRVYVFLYGLLH